jgi:putative flippase GtrA
MNFIYTTLGKYLNPTNSLFRFLLVGIVNTAFGLTIMFLLLNVFQLSYWFSTFIGNTAGACISFILNRTYTFNSNVSYMRGIPRFLVIILICYISAYFFSERIFGWISTIFFFSTSLEQNGAVFLGSVLYTISNYFGQKHFVFRNVKTV